MSDNILVVAENDIYDGQLDNLKALVMEVMESIQHDEPGTLNYEWFIADDGKSVNVFERYVDSEAFLVHLTNLGQKKYAERMFACLNATKVTIYGNPSDPVRGIFANFPTFYIRPFVGVAR
jgi:quinol monooxygenase YgiN